MPKPSATNTAFVLKRETRASGRWLEIGVANIEVDGRTGAHHVYIDRLPVGGFAGHILLQPIGVLPPDPQIAPSRPGEEDL